MSENETGPQSSKPTQPRMKDGEEPTEVLLALVSSPLMSLIDRGMASLVTGRDAAGQEVLAVLFANSQWLDGIGIANTANAANTANTANA
jgi:hypothetical protein